MFIRTRRPTTFTWIPSLTFSSAWDENTCWPQKTYQWLQGLDGNKQIVCMKWISHVCFLEWEGWDWEKEERIEEGWDWKRLYERLEWGKKGWDWETDSEKKNGNTSSERRKRRAKLGVVTAGLLPGGNWGRGRCPAETQNIRRQPEIRLSDSRWH